MVPSNWALRGLEVCKLRSIIFTLQFYDGPNNFGNASFHNFKDPRNLQLGSILGVLDHDVFNIGHGSDADPAKGNYVNGFTIDDSTTPLFAYPWASTIPLEDGEKQFFGWDNDGSLTKRPPVNGVKTTFLANEPFLFGSGCIALEPFTRAIMYADLTIRR